jgi:ATP-dependent Lon protease, bacterial type
MPELTGRSLHFASIVATVSLITGRYINPEFVFTGTLNVNGKSEKIGHLIEKSELVKAERGTSVKIVIPDINSFPKPERDYIENNRNIFKPVKNLEELIEAAFEIPADEVLTIQDEKRYEIGSTRLIAENLGVRQLTLYHRFDDYKFSHAVHNFNVVRCKVFEPIGLENKSVYNVYPLQQINFLPNPRNGLETLVVINFRTSISLTANLVSNNPQSRDIYAIRMGPKSDEYQIFAHPQGKSREYVGKYFNQADLELSGNYGSQSNQGY